MKDFRIPIHPAGWPIIAAFFAVSSILGLLWWPLGFIGLLLSGWCVYFFRDPERVVPVRPGVIVAPADGMIANIGPAPLPKELEMGDQVRTRISIFLNIFDVHVTRMPAKGKVSKIFYFPGLFLNASLDKASELNERYATALDIGEGENLVVVQIAGLIARRIKNDLLENMSVDQGERFGIIRFGSRVDVYLPQGMDALVLEGQRTIGGETVIAGS
jgi:phosphatidylserine decarboxylase